MRVHSTHPPYLIEFSASELAEIELALEEHRRVSWLRAKQLTDSLGSSLHVPGPDAFVRELDDVLEQLEVLDPSAAAGWVEGDLFETDLFDDLVGPGPCASRCHCELCDGDPLGRPRQRGLGVESPPSRGSRVTTVTPPAYRPTMTPVISILALLVGLCIGGGYALRVRSLAAAQHQQFAEAAAAAAQRESTLQVELARAQSLAATGDQMLAAFRAVSADALATQSQQFLQLAETKYGTLQQSTDTVVSAHSQAVGDGLARLGERLTSLEKERSSSTVELRTMVAELSLATAATKAEAAKLAAAMSDNRVRGAWGEVQLRRALELAGLSRHVDFAEQSGVTDGAASGRPDVVVHLPNGHDVVIDSKVPLDRYLQAVDATDPAAEHELQVEHAKAVAEARQGPRRPGLRDGCWSPRSTWSSCSCPASRSSPPRWTPTRRCSSPQRPRASTW